MVSVYLHGYFSAFHDGPLLIAAATAAEAVEAVSRQLPGFKPTPKGGRHRVKVVGCQTIEDLHRPLETNEVHLVPQFLGGKDSGVVQVVLGVALVAASFIPGIGAWTASFLLQSGALMLLGSLAQLFAPQPETDKGTDKSRYLGAPKNTVAIGTRIPILYGEFRVYGHYLSFDINAREFRGSGGKSTSGGGKL